MEARENERQRRRQRPSTRPNSESNLDEVVLGLDLRNQRVVVRLAVLLRRRRLLLERLWARSQNEDTARVS